jgi:hypothetical protein
MATGVISLGWATSTTAHYLIPTSCLPITSWRRVDKKKPWLYQGF